MPTPTYTLPFDGGLAFPDWIKCLFLLVRPTGRLLYGVEDEQVYFREEDGRLRRLNSRTFGAHVEKICRVVDSRGRPARLRPAALWLHSCDRALLPHIRVEEEAVIA